MISYEVLNICILMLFFASTVLAFFGLISRRQQCLFYGCILFTIAFLSQTASFFLGFHKSFLNGLSGGAYIQLVAWFIGLCSLVLWLRFRQKIALTFAAPLCTLLFALSLPYTQKSVLIPSSLDSSFYFLHIGLLFTSLALMAISFIVSLIFLAVERTIKQKKRIQPFLEDTPALSWLDAINGKCILAIFPCYTIGILSGLLRAKPIYGATFSGDPKEILSFFVWALLAFLFHNRLAKSWTGKKPAITMIIIFLLSLFSLLGINTLMNSHHTFMIN